MAIGKGKPTSAIMVRSGEIAPHRTLAWISGVAKNEPSVIDAVRMLVEENKDTRGLAAVASFQELPPKRIDRAAVTFITDERIHRQASSARAGVRGHDISGAFENPHAF